MQMCYEPHRHRIGEIGEPNKRGNKSIRMCTCYVIRNTRYYYYCLTLYCYNSYCTFIKNGGANTIHPFVYSSYTAAQEYKQRGPFICTNHMYSPWPAGTMRDTNALTTTLRLSVSEKKQEGEHAKEMQISSIYYLYHLLCV